MDQKGLLNSVTERMKNILANVLVDKVEMPGANGRTAMSALLFAFVDVHRPQLPQRDIVPG